MTRTLLDIEISHIGYMRYLNFKNNNKLRKSIPDIF